MRIDVFLSYSDIKIGTKIAKHMPVRVRNWWKEKVDFHWRCFNMQRRAKYPEKCDFTFFFPPNAMRCRMWLGSIAIKLHMARCHKCHAKAVWYGISGFSCSEHI